MIPARPRSSAGPRAVLLAVLALAFVHPGAAGGDTLDFATLARAQPALLEMAASARRHGTTFGIWGGTVRDLYLGRPFSPISDLDLIFDSSEPSFPAFRDDVLGIHRRRRGRMPSPDFHYDLSPAASGQERHRQFHEEGITATKVGLFADGRVHDPTGLGLADLRRRVVRFHAPARRMLIDLHNLGRFVRDVVRLHRFRRDPATIELLRSSLARHADPATPQGRRARAVAALLRAQSGDLVTFRSLIRHFRRDVRYLHDGQTDRLTELFPLDIFVFDLFKCVTQADDVASMREVFSSLGVGDFLERIGLAPEARILSDASRSREDLFRALGFPGRVAAADPTAIPFLSVWEDTLRRYNYRVLFDMLASEFPPRSREAASIRERRDGFLSPGTYRTLDPGDDYREEVVGALATDFNLGLLPRARVIRGLDWFLSTYLPLGDVTLKPVGPSTAPLPASVRTALRPGLSPEVLAIDPRVPHGMRGLEAYLDLQLGAEVRPLYRDGRTAVLFLASGEPVAAGILRALGYTGVYRVNAAGSSRRRRTLLGHDPRTGRVAIAEHSFSSHEQLLNHQARVLMTRRPSASSTRHALTGATPTGPVLVLAGPDRLEFPDRAQLERWLDATSGPIDALFIGFSHPLKSLLARARTVRVGDLQLVVGDLPGAGPRRARRGLALSGFGASFGSLPAKVLAVVARRGLRHVVFLGTGGGLSRAVPRLGWICPDRVVRAGAGGAPEGPVLAFENGARALWSQAAGGLHATVFSPLVETRAWVRAMRQRGVVSVDCELFHVVEAARLWTPDASIHALINVTDFPSEGGPDGGAIGLENSPEQSAAVRAALAAILSDLAPPPEGLEARRPGR